VAATENINISVVAIILIT